MDHGTTANDITIYGETESLDCPNEGKDGFCYMIDKFGMNSHASCTIGKLAHETASSKFPLEKFKGTPTWGITV